MPEKNYSLDKETKRQIRAALWQIRHEKHLYLKNITTQTGIPCRIIEGMELGKFIQYGALRRLTEFYGKKIKISFEYISPSKLNCTQESGNTPLR